MTFYNANVMATVWTGTAVYDHRHEIVQPVRIDCIVGRIKQPQLEREHDTVGNFDVPVVLLHVLEPFQVQGQYHGQLLNAHPFLCLLIAATVITFEFVITTQRFGVAEATQAVRYAGVLVHVHLQIEKVLVLAANRLAVQTACLTR